MAVFCVVDDKHIPLYRVLWVAAVPHFCGHDDCEREGQYEVRLEQGESVWANHAERDLVLNSLEEWQAGLGPLSDLPHGPDDVPEDEIDDDEVDDDDGPPHN